MPRSHSFIALEQHVARAHRELFCAYESAATMGAWELSEDIWGLIEEVGRISDDLLKGHFPKRRHRPSLPF